MDAAQLKVRMPGTIARLRDTRGTTAVEFALVGPVFIMLIVGVVYTSLLLFAMGSLQYAVEEAARCASVKTTVCTSSTSTASYAQSHFFGSLVLTPAFTSTTATCGHQVRATASYNLNIGLDSLTVPISAAACFP
jgi:Flp pilus assembly protein TadG